MMEGVLKYEIVALQELSFTGFWGWEERDKGVT